LNYGLSINTSAKDWKHKFFGFLAHEVSLEVFEQWVYKTEELETVFSSKDYLELISFNYRQSDAGYKLRDLLEQHISLGEFETVQLRALLLKILDRDVSSLKAVTELYYLYCEGYYFLDNLALGYCLYIIDKLDDGDFDVWNTLNSNQRRTFLREVFPDIDTEINKVLSWLDSQTIVVMIEQKTKEITIIDKRNAQEKIPTSYKISTPNK